MMMMPLLLMTDVCIFNCFVHYRCSTFLGRHRKDGGFPTWAILEDMLGGRMSPFPTGRLHEYRTVRHGQPLVKEIGKLSIYERTGVYDRISQTI